MSPASNLPGLQLLLAGQGYGAVPGNASTPRTRFEVRRVFGRTHDDPGRRRPMLPAPGRLLALDTAAAPSPRRPRPTARVSGRHRRGRSRYRLRSPTRGRCRRWPDRNASTHQPADVLVPRRVNGAHRSARLAEAWLHGPCRRPELSRCGDRPSEPKAGAPKRRCVMRVRSARESCSRRHAKLPYTFRKAGTPWWRGSGRAWRPPSVGVPVATPRLTGPLGVRSAAVSTTRSVAAAPVASSSIRACSARSDCTHVGEQFVSGHQLGSRASWCRSRRRSHSPNARWLCGDRLPSPFRVLKRDRLAMPLLGVVAFEQGPRAGQTAQSQ